MPLNRNYNLKDINMLIASSTIAENAIINKAFLQTKRTSWADPFFDDLKTKIDTAMQTHLGIDSAKELRQATVVILGIQGQAAKDLAEAKIQISEDFKSDKPRRDEILKQLGFTNYLKASHNGDQEAMINLLFQYKKNLTPELRIEIANKGTNASLLDAIIGYADYMKNADITQETFKSSRKTTTDAAIKEFNEIYDSVISICKIAARFYKDLPALQEQFSFKKVSNKLNVTSFKPTPPAKPQ
jgi:hypothetical protein